MQYISHGRTNTSQDSIMDWTNNAQVSYRQKCSNFITPHSLIDNNHGRKKIAFLSAKWNTLALIAILPSEKGNTPTLIAM
jgi:RNA-binding protein YlmH